MNNLSSYCGLLDAKIRASDKDLPVSHKFHTFSINSDVEQRSNISHQLSLTMEDPSRKKEEITISNKKPSSGILNQLNYNWLL
jgi:hypothetical protein